MARDNEHLGDILFLLPYEEMMSSLQHVTPKMKTCWTNRKGVWLPTTKGQIL